MADQGARAAARFYPYCGLERRGHRARRLQADLTLPLPLNLTLTLTLTLTYP